MSKTYLEAKRDVKGFTIVDDDGYELSFDLKQGSRVQIHEWVGTEYDEVWVRLFRDDEEPCCADANDFRVVTED